MSERFYSYCNVEGGCGVVCLVMLSVSTFPVIVMWKEVVVLCALLSCE